MCGIFGYIGTPRQTGAFIVEGLKSLEYRGYDSWGVAWLEPTGDVRLEKEVGKIGGVVGDAWGQAASVAIGHTRWATHGGVTRENAHPHLSADGRIAVVHNGIVENYQALRAELTQRGVVFRSETDTEVIAHLVAEEVALGKDLPMAVRASLLRCHGRNGVLVLQAGDQRLVAVRSGSPLIAGVLEGGYVIASDIPAFLRHTRQVQYLDDGEMAVCDGRTLHVTDVLSGEPREKRIVEIGWSAESAEKGDYAHYMLKEIMDQKESVLRALHQDPVEIEAVATAIRNARGTFLVGCGTAGKACQAAEYFFSVVAEHHVNVAVASEFKLYHHFLRPESLLICVSQSGETADVLEAIGVAKARGSKVLAIVNVEGSSISRAADYTLLIRAGPERAVASTKALTGQLAVLLLIAYALRGQLTQGLLDLRAAGAMVNDLLNPRYVEHVSTIARELQHHEDLYIIGRSWHYPMATESAIKIQEVSYIHAEGFAGGELKHGPIALIEPGTVCLVLAGNDEVLPDIISNAVQLKARGAFVVGIAPEPNEVFDRWIRVPDAGHAQPILSIIPVQVLAYFLAVCRGKDPDMPRNLAKSVVVK